MLKIVLFAMLPVFTSVAFAGDMYDHETTQDNSPKVLSIKLGKLLWTDAFRPICGKTDLRTLSSYSVKVRLQAKTFADGFFSYDPSKVVEDKFTMTDNHAFEDKDLISFDYLGVSTDASKHYRNNGWLVTDGKQNFLLLYHDSNSDQPDPGYPDSPALVPTSDLKTILAGKDPIVKFTGGRFEQTVEKSILGFRWTLERQELYLDPVLQPGFDPDQVPPCPAGLE